MEASTIDTIIQTGGLMLIAFVGMREYSRIARVRRVISKERELLLDCFYLRCVIDKYMDYFRERGEKIHYEDYRKKVLDDLGYTCSEQSEKAKITRRLESLAENDRALDLLMGNIKKFS